MEGNVIDIDEYISESKKNSKASDETAQVSRFDKVKGMLQKFQTRKTGYVVGVATAVAVVAYVVGRPRFAKK